MSEEKKELPSFQLTGKMDYELELHPNEFLMRYQVCHENNLANAIYLRDITSDLIKRDSRPDVLKKDKQSKEYMNMVKQTNRLMALWAEELAGFVYGESIKQGADKPKIEISQPLANLKVVK